MKKYKIVAFMGKSASGKDTTVNKLCNKYNHLNKIISTTTRPIRDNETEGVDYNFVSHEAFTEKVLNYEMLEVCDFNDWFYGTEISSLDKDKVNIGVFNPDGIEALAEDSRIELTVVYLNAPDKLRIMRALQREENPNVHEICRRFFTDDRDFADERLEELNRLHFKSITAFITEEQNQISQEVVDFILGISI